MTLIDPIELTCALIKCPSVTPKDAGALDLLEATLNTLGFDTTRLPFEQEGTPPVDNLYARIGTQGPNFCFAGHTDVVPAGRLDAWSAPPFDAYIKDDILIGRGAADMKGAIAAFVAGASHYLASNNNGTTKGSISLLITGDEEGPAINGTRKMLDWLKQRGEVIDHCLVGEPTNPDKMGEMIKAGRRGSINGWISVHGKQGHVAYPHRAKNPLHGLAGFLSHLTDTPLDDGYARFQPSSLQITEIETHNPAHNIIPADVKIRFNVRFNPNWTGESVAKWVADRLDEAQQETGFSYDLETIISGEAFLTTDDDYLSLLSDCVEQATGQKPELSTSGGTSDARFIQRDTPVAEFGLVGATIHQIDEQTSLSDITLLSNIYADILKQYFRRYS